MRNVGLFVLGLVLVPPGAAAATKKPAPLEQAEQRHATLSKEQAMLFDELREINTAARQAAKEPSPEHLLQVEQLSHDLEACAGEAKKTHALQRRA